MVGTWRVVSLVFELLWQQTYLKSWFLGILVSNVKIFVHPDVNVERQQTRIQHIAKDRKVCSGGSFHTFKAV